METTEITLRLTNVPVELLHEIEESVKEVLMKEQNSNLPAMTKNFIIDYQEACKRLPDQTMTIISAISSLYYTIQSTYHGKEKAGL